MLILYFLMGLGVTTARTDHRVSIRPEYLQQTVQDTVTPALGNHQIENSSVDVNLTNDTTSESLKGMDYKAKHANNKIELLRELNKGFKQDPNKMGIVTRQEIPDWTSDIDTVAIGNHPKEARSVGDDSLTNTTSGKLNVTGYRLATSSEREAAFIKIVDELNDLDDF